jgi:hypothetical protein
MPPRKPPSARAAAAAARPKSQYKQIDKRKYDRRALDLADDAERTRGRVHASDAARVWHDVHDGGRVTDIEYATLARIAMDGMYKMTRGVTTFFRDKVSAHRRWRTLRRTVEFVALAKAGARRHRRNEDEDEFENERERERGGWEPTSTPSRAARAAWQRILPALLALLATRAIVPATAATGSPPRAVAGAAAAAAAAAVLVPALIATWVRSISHWSPYDRVGVVNAIDSLRTLSPGASLRPGSLAHNPGAPRRLSTPLLTPLNSSPTTLSSYGPSTLRRWSSSGCRRGVR